MKTRNLFICGLLMTCMGMSVCVSGAETGEMTETPAEMQTETVSIPTEEGALELVNLSDMQIIRTETKEEEAAGDDAAGVTLLLTDADSVVHTFENFPLTMTDPTLMGDDGFLYVSYKDESGEKEMAYENAEEVIFDAPVSKYITNQVNIRAQAGTDSEVIGVAALGSEVKAVGASPRWVQIETEDGQRGYIARSCVSPSKEEAQAALDTDQAVREAQAAAAARAAQQAAAAAAAQQSQGGGRTEVSRQNFDDCDGSGHGYAVITYSDGSTSTVNY